MKYLSLLILMFVNFSAQAIAQEKSRTITLEETANKDVELSITTDHGRLEVIEWDKELVRLEATIVVEGKKPDDTEKALETFDVKITGNSSKFKIEKGYKTPTGGKIKDGDYYVNINLKKQDVTYKIYAPKGAELKIIHKFGEVVVGNFSRGIDLKLSHGDFSAQELQEDTKLSMNFGKAYVGKVHKANFALNHYKMYLNIAAGLNADLNFSELELKELSDDLKANVNHSTVEVQAISSSSIQNIHITANFSDVELDFKEGSSVELNLNSNRGSQKFKSSYKKVVAESETYQSKQMQILLGNGKSKSTKVTITQNFGNLAVEIED